MDNTKPKPPKINYKKKFSAAEIEIADLKRLLVKNQAALDASQASQQTAEILSILTAQIDVVLLYDTRMNVKRANPSFIQFFGFDPVGLYINEIIQRVSCRRLDGKPLILEEQPTARALHGEKVANILYLVSRADGTDAIVETSSVPLIHDGIVTGSVTVWHDVTQFKQTEQALRESEARFRLVLKHAPVTVAAQDKELRFIWVYNQRTVRSEDVLGKTDSDLFAPEYAGRLIALKRQVLETGTELRDQFWMKSGDRRLYLDLFLEPIRDQAGQITGVGAATVDLTDRKLAEEALLKTRAELEERVEARTQELVRSNKQLMLGVDERKRVEDSLRLANAYNRSLLEASLDPLVTITQDGKIGDVNKATEIVTGCRRDELIGTDFHEYFTDPERARSGYRQVFETGAVRDYELEIRHQDGHITPVFYNASLYRDESGEVIGVFAAARDISERKESEGQLLLLTTALESAANGIFITDRQGDIIWSNPALARMTGYSFDELYGQNPRILKSGAHDETFYRQMWDTILSGKVWQSELSNRRKDGSLYTEEQTVTPVRDSDGFISHFIAIKQDITERKKAELALVEANELLERVFDSMDTQIAYMDRNFNFLRVNRAYARDAWHEPDFFIGKNHFKLYPHAENEAIFRQVVETGEPYLVYEKPFEYAEFPERGISYWDWGLQPVKGQDGKVNGIVLSLVNVTGRKQAEIALRESEERYRSMVETSPDAIILVGMDQKIIFANQQSAVMHGYGQADELAGMDANKLLAPEDWERARESARSALRSGSMKGIEYTFIKQDGTRFPGELNIAVVRNTHGKPIAIHWDGRDITERKRAEIRLEQNNRELLALSQSERKQRQIAETLRLTSLALTQTMDVDTELKILLEHMGRLIPFDRASAALLGGDGYLQIRVTQRNPEWVLPEQEQNPQAITPIPPDALELLSTTQSLVLSELHEPPSWSPLPGIEHMRSWLGIPLVTEGKVFGLCSLGKTELGFYTQEHAQLAEAFVAHASMAVQNAWLFEQVRAGRERLQALSHRLVDIQETERRSIARELHDEAGQALASMMIDLRLLEQDVHDPEASLARVKELRGITESVMEELHRMAINLRPASLDHLGLAAALKQYIESINERKIISIQFEAIGFENGRLNPAIETSLYRIVQEAVTNALLHAQASEIAVILDWRGDHVIVIVEDNGVGFDPESLTGRGRLGMVGMRERAEMLGGTLTVESEIGAGTTIYVEVPWV